MKRFDEAFPGLNPPKDMKAYFDISRIVRVSAGKDMQVLRIHMESERLIEKEIIYKMEDCIKNSLFSGKKMKVKILEKFRLSNLYNPENLYAAYKNSILTELRRYRITQYLMLSRGEVRFEGNSLFLSVEDNLLNREEAGDLIHILEKIFFERCGMDCRVEVTFIPYRPPSLPDSDYENKRENREDSHRDVFMAAASGLLPEEGDFKSPEAENPAMFPESPKEKRRASAGEKRAPAQRGGRFEAGKKKNPDLLFGRDFPDSFLALQDIMGEMGEVSIWGKIIDLDFRYLEKSQSTMFVFSISDFTDSITVKLFVRENDLADVRSYLKKGEFVKVRGMTTLDKFDGELIIGSVRGLKKAGSFAEAAREDAAPLKRVELHCHTKMSDFDGVSGAKDLIEQASRWGMEAIAITDHGNVQSFTDAVHAYDDLQKKKAHLPKIIYGLEAYLIDDKKGFLTNPGETTLDDAFVVFDIETTGLSAVKDRIIEIGAVKMRQGVILERFSSFINPGIPIPYKIEILTGINDRMVLDAPPIEEVLPRFLAFCEGCVAVAHNASFDTGFIREKARCLSLPYNPPIVDTVGLSRVLLPHLGRHTLDSVAKALEISLENHHRAVDDAEATAFIWLKFAGMLRAKGAFKLCDMEEHVQTTKESLKRLRSSHAVLLAKNDIGRINLYKLVSLSHVEYFYKNPRIPKSLLMEHREGLLVGSACTQGELYQAILDGRSNEELKSLVDFYDYLEIQPVSQQLHLIEDDRIPVESKEDLCRINERIVRLGEEYRKPVTATGDVHFLHPEDEIYRKILRTGKDIKNADFPSPMYFRTTREMLEEFSYLGEEKAREVVIHNTREIARRIEPIRPVRPDRCPPVIADSDRLLRESCYDKAHAQYGRNLPPIVETRLEKELGSIITNGFAVMYIIAQKLVKKSNDDGYLVGSRGSVGSSFAAYAAGITEVNPLPPHYYCDCFYTDFDSEEVLSHSGMAGCDLPDKICPSCGKKLKKDGFDIPFETFLGFDGDKEPDIDLNFSGEYQPNAHDYTEVLFGKGYTFRAGTVGTLADKTAYGYVKKYYDEKGIFKRKCEINRITAGCVGVKRTTGQHPGGIIVLPHGEEIYSFTPVQRPANDMGSKTITTHFDYHAIDHNLLKLDILGHQDPTMIRMLQDLTGIDPVRDIPLDCKKTMSLFQDTSALGISPEDIGGCKLGALGVPEFGTEFAMQMLIETKPQGLSDLVRIAGLAHGTDVWLGNAQTLIQEKKATIRTAICTRDDIMIYLIGKGLEEGLSFQIMELVRKGKGLLPDQKAAMEAAGVPDWYIASCEKIKYMFPKAHAAAYVMMAWRIAYCKIFYPLAYYTAYYTVRASGFSYSLMGMGREKLEYHMRDLEMKKREDKITAKETDVLRDMRIVQEMYARGIEFCPIDIYRAQGERFIITEEGKIMPSLKSIDGLGEIAAGQIAAAAKEGAFMSRDDLMSRAKIGKSTCDLLGDMGLLGSLPQSNQISIFDLLA